MTRKTKAASPVPDSPVAGATSTPDQAPDLQLPAPDVPKPAKRRAPAKAAAAPTEEATTAEAPAAGKAAAKKAPRVAAKQAVEQEAPPAAKTAKAKKAKLVRDSFTMPAVEHALIDAIKKRCLAQGLAARKSEVLRAALASLAGLEDESVASAIRSLEPVKTGRPAKGR